MDALLAKFALEDKLQATAVTEHTNGPSARVYSSFTPVSPQQVQSWHSELHSFQEQEFYSLHTPNSDKQHRLQDKSRLWNWFEELCQMFQKTCMHMSLSDKQYLQEEQSEMTYCSQNLCFAEGQRCHPLWWRVSGH